MRTKRDYERPKGLRAGSGLVDVMDVIRWHAQAKEDAAKWHRDVNGMDPARLAEKSDWRAGFSGGWQACMRTLALQGIVVEFDRVRP